MIYSQIGDANKQMPRIMFAKSNEDLFQPSDDVREARAWLKENNDTTSEEFRNNKNILIQYYKECISKYPSWSMYDFNFKANSEYESVKEFLSDVKRQGYSMTFKPVSKDYIDCMVEQGKFYLFELTCRDLSEHSTGKKNLNVTYFEDIFSEENLLAHKSWLQGASKMFLREKSIPYNVTHPANEPIRRRQLTQEEETQGLTLDDVHSEFPYDIIKDRHYTENVFSIQLPISLNYLTDSKFNKTRLNDEIMHMVESGKIKRAIGIDRGERNLITVVLGEFIEGTTTMRVLESKSMNIINGTDYQKLLKAKSTDRKSQQKAWQQVEAIKNIKHGYCSQAVSEICKMAIENNAVIFLEDLNRKFMQNRSSLDVEVYRRFEDALISKLNYYVDKDISLKDGSLAPGRSLNALQLTPVVEKKSNKGTQLGILFFVPAWNTSNMDPVTGFTNLFRSKSLRYKSVEASKRFFDKIKMSPSEDGVVFEFDYKDFDNLCATPPKEYPTWTLRSSGKRIIKTKDHNGYYRYERVDMKQRLEDILDSFGIDPNSKDLDQYIKGQDSAEFWKEFLYHFRLLLQLRNSDNNGNDYIYSPVCDSDGNQFHTSHECTISDADQNGALNILSKGAMILQGNTKLDNTSYLRHKVKETILFD